jgi:integrase
MNRRRPTPSYRLHKQTGKAIVTVYDADGRRRGILLPGKFESKESRAEYKRLLARLNANDGALPQPEAKAPDLAIAELIARFMEERVLTYYVDPVTKTPTGEQENFRCAMRPLDRLFGDTPVNEFAPLDLVAVQKAMASGSWLSDDEKKKAKKTGRAIGLARNTINARVARIKLMFSWAVVHKLVLPGVYHGLLAVKGLARGRSEARETDAITPVAVAVVQDTLPHLPPLVRDVVELLLLTGMRVGEAVGMRADEIDMTGEVWLFTPEKHKTAWRGHKRMIAIGPRGQEIIRRHLKTQTGAVLFSPTEQEAIIAARKRATRKTPVQPSQQNRRKTRRKKKPGDQFTHRDINRAIKRACRRFGIPEWHTHQLRHTAALEVSRQHGLEAARAVLGHKSLQMSADYAGHDKRTAAEVMAKIG